MKTTSSAAKVGGINTLNVYGARTHNLKNIDVSIPRNQLTVITGVSGSGKSSLAFDTIYAEGQRRYIETFSVYARTFLGNIDRPDVDKIEGLSPVICIDQKAMHRNPRSTVGTLTEINDYLRLLYARIGVAHSYVTGETMVRYTEESIVERILADYQGERVVLLAPVVKGRKGHYRELFESLRKRGFLYVMVDGETFELERGLKTDRYKTHDIDVVVDKIAVSEKAASRVKKSISTALRAGNGVLKVLVESTGDIQFYSQRLMCPTSGVAYADPEPSGFSFNSPRGWCQTCKGLGYISEIDSTLLIKDKKLSIAEGGIIPLGRTKENMLFWQIESILEKYGCSLTSPISTIPKACMDEILYGSVEKVRIRRERCKTSNDYFVAWDGVLTYLRSVGEMESASAQQWLENFLRDVVCPECGGLRLNREALSYTIAGQNIGAVCSMDLYALLDWIKGLAAVLSDYEMSIAQSSILQIESLVETMLQIGLGYLSLDRSSTTLSGGESQRLRLSAQVGSRLVNVLYILDEPSIGMHPRDTQRLITILRTLVARGNTVIVVEHNEEIIAAADCIVNIGPRAGEEGGYLCERIEYKESDKIVKLKPKTSDKLILKGCRGNNLKTLDVAFPLGRMIVVTGVSGSGKSSLIDGTLYAALAQKKYGRKAEPLPFKEMIGDEKVKRVVRVDQSPIGRNSRSNAATYIGVMDDIRELYASLPDSELRGWTKSRFSFNVRGGRCEECKGNGYKVLEMRMMNSVSVRCDVCQGKRYTKDTLSVKYRGKNIAEVLALRVSEAADFFSAIPMITRKLNALIEVGLGYLSLGQSVTTLSGGENQRVKLASALIARESIDALFLFDEPTTGLSTWDINILLKALRALVNKGNTVIIVEHNLQIIAAADHIIDLGLEGGSSGGYIVEQGTPSKLIKSNKGYTSAALRSEMLKER